MSRHRISAAAEKSKLTSLARFAPQLSALDLRSSGSYRESEDDELGWPFSMRRLERVG